MLACMCMHLCLYYMLLYECVLVFQCKFVCVSNFCDNIPVHLSMCMSMCVHGVLYVSFGVSVYILELYVYKSVCVHWPDRRALAQKVDGECQRQLLRSNTQQRNHEKSIKPLYFSLATDMWIHFGGDKGEMVFLRAPHRPSFLNPLRTRTFYYRSFTD